MRDRLIELLRSNNAAPEKTCPRFGTGESCEGCKYLTDDMGCDYIAREADYLLADGWMRPPCKVGDEVWCIIEGFDQLMEGRVRRFTIYEYGINVYCGINGYYEQVYTDKDFGKTVFLTREEAEAALVNYESSKNEKGGVE